MALPRYPSLKNDITRLIEHTSRWTMAQRTQLFSESTHYSQHEGGDAVIVVEGEEHKVEYQELVSEQAYTIDELKTMTPERILEMSQAIGQDIGDQQMKHNFKRIDDAVTGAGNVVKSNGKITHDTFLDALEKIDINFDEEGNPDMPTMVVSSKTAKQIQALRDIDETPAQKQRHEMIMKQKRIDYDAREDRRKLVD